jgi:transcriptional regulator with XRE-family HTH domain
LTKSVHSPRYTELRRLIIAARKKAGLTQLDVAARLGKPQSYVSTVESGERRIDVVELIEFGEAVGFDAAAMVRRVGRG